MPEKINKEDVGISAEQRILEAAIEEFTKKGYAGARMQSIADNAEISKSALHYYFRDKERLFWKVLDETVGKAINRLKFELNESGSFEKKLRRGISEYYHSIRENISVVKFLLCELNRSPDIVNNFLNRQNYLSWMGEIKQELEKEYLSGRINNIQVEDLILNMISLCIFPQIAAPMVKRVLQKTDQEYEDLLTKREGQIIEMILRMIIKPEHRGIKK